MSLTVETDEHGDITILTLTGELDLAGVPSFEAQLLTLTFDSIDRASEVGNGDPPPLV